MDREGNLKVVGFAVSQSSTRDTVLVSADKDAILPAGIFRPLGF